MAAFTSVSVEPKSHGCFNVYVNNRYAGEVVRIGEYPGLEGEHYGAFVQRSIKSVQIKQVFPSVDAAADAVWMKFTGRR